MEFYHHLKLKETGPVPEFVVSMGRFYNFKSHHAFRSVKALGRLRALMLTLCTRMNSGPSSRRGVQARAGPQHG